MPRPRAEERLARLRREVGRSRGRNAKAGDKRRSRRRHSRNVALSAVLAIVKLSAIIALPFVVYVRSSVFLYDHGAHVWVAIVGAAGLTMALVLIYAAGLGRQLHGRARVRSLLRWIALPIVAAWCLSSLFYLARVNAKSDEVRGYFLSVHPILRVALSTVILVDPGIVITDMARRPSDYGRMGLPMNDKSMHFEQPTAGCMRWTCVRNRTARSGTGRCNSISSSWASVRSAMWELPTTYTSRCGDSTRLTGSLRALSKPAFPAVGPGR